MFLSDNVVMSYFKTTMGWSIIQHNNDLNAVGINPSWWQFWKPVRFVCQSYQLPFTRSIGHWFTVAKKNMANPCAYFMGLSPIKYAHAFAMFFVAVKLSVFSECSYYHPKWLLHGYWRMITPVLMKWYLKAHRWMQNKCKMHAWFLRYVNYILNVFFKTYLSLDNSHNLRCFFMFVEI